MSAQVDESPPAAVLVMLHGLGMRPEVLAPFPAAMRLPVAAVVPRGPVTWPDGGRAWWPVDPAARARRLAAGQGVDLCDRQPAGRERARDALSACLQQVARDWPGLPVMALGFSQGGMLALDHLLHAAVSPRWAGLALLSSSRLDWRSQAAAWSRLAGLPVLVAHGRQDCDLAFRAGEGLRDSLRQAGAQVDWRPFDGGHDIPLVVWRAVRRWALDCLQGGAARREECHDDPP